MSRGCVGGKQRREREREKGVGPLGRSGIIRNVHVEAGMVDEERGNYRKRWGTWEELVLGGAILRHGSQAWDDVASELQTRTLRPYLFTPQVCKDKYDDVVKHYSSSFAWFQELRKRRVDELRRELEQSEDSISSLESKLESLKTKKEVSNDGDYSSSRAESPTFHKSEENRSSGKEASKNRSSAGSFTDETHTIRSPQFQSARGLSVEKAEIEPVAREKPCRLEKFPSIEKLAETFRSEHGVSIRRKRGQRRRKDLSKNVKEGSVGENNLLGATDSVTCSQGMEKFITDCGRPMARLLDVNDHNPCTSKQETDDFTKILDSIMEDEHAAVFRRRLDSQKRARYKKMIRQHIDLDTIRCRIGNKSITSSVELLRDLLLLANNALVFYSKSTREYKCALLLRNLVTNKISPPAETPKSPVCRPPAKPRSTRPFNRKVVLNCDMGSNVGPKERKRPPTSRGSTSPSSAESSVLTKRIHGPGRRGKVGRIKRGNAGIQAETPMKVRKRARVK